MFKTPVATYFLYHDSNSSVDCFIESETLLLLMLFYYSPLTPLYPNSLGWLIESITPVPGIHPLGANGTLMEQKAASHAPSPWKLPWS